MRVLFRTRCALIALSLWCGPNIAGCSGEAPESASPPALPSEVPLGSLPQAERSTRVDALLVEAGAQLARAEPPTRVAAAAAAAIEIARLGGPARYLTKARELLEQAAALRGPLGCDSALQLARLRSTLLRDLTAAHATAERAAALHRGDPRCAACVADLERMAEALASYRASEAVAPSPSTELATQGGDTLADRAIVDFVDAREERGQAATLDEIAVYGRGQRGEPGAAEARVVLRFDDVAIYRRSELPAGDGLPRRLALDLDGVELGPQIEPLINVGAAGLSRVRVTSLGGGQARVTFDIAPSTAYRLFFLSDPYRVVMDFRDEAQRSAVGAYTIVLDPGHGGEATGAKGHNGLREAEVALSLALRVRRALARTLPDVRVVMTRDRDVDVSLEARSALANALDADLFVSIHLNASSSPEDKGGVSTYTLDSSTDAAALRLAAQENGTDEQGVSALQLVLASLFRKDQVEHSRGLAEEVQSSLLRSARKLYPELNDRGVKRALFYVLVGARMPAILVEASFITRPEEAVLLATDAYRQAVADGIAQGIERYVTRARAGGSR